MDSATSLTIEMSLQLCMVLVYHILSNRQCFSRMHVPDSLNHSNRGETMKVINAPKFLRRSAFGLILIQSSTLALHGQALLTTTTDFPTLGNPTSAIATSDGVYVFVSVTNVGGENFSGPDSAAGARKDVVSGIQIFRRAGRSLNDAGGMKSVGFIRTGSTGANGLAFLKDEKTLAVGVGDAGVAFLNVHDAIGGTAKPYFASQGDGAGTFDVVASPDGKFVFSSNEYGIIDGERGNIGVIAVNSDRMGRVTLPQTISQMPVGDVVPSLTLSPDGLRLYIATELVPSKGSQFIAGASNTILTKADCVQKKGSPPRVNGFITVMDVQRLRNRSKNAILARIAAGCSPVRLIENSDASVLFVSARGDDAILAFTPRLLESDPEHAFVRAFPSGGTAPVGMRLFAQDRLLAVANSNRFADSNGTVAILDVSKLSDTANHTPIKAWVAGAFPRNIGISRDKKTLYVTNYTSRCLQVIQTTAH